MAPLTPKLLRMLRAVDRYGMDGTIEMYMDYGELEAKPVASGDVHEQDGADWRLTQFVCGGLIARLKAKGLVAGESGSLEVTDAGRRYLV